MKKEEKTHLLFVLAPSHLALLILFISWPILYLLIFTTQPGFILGDTQNFLTSFEGGSGTVLTTGSGNLNNTLLSDEGRQTVLWTSFLISLLLTILMYLIFFYM